MAWNNPVINGSQPANTNKPYLNENSDYISTKVSLDHYWDEDSNLDGRHRYCQMAESETGGTPVDPTLGTSIDLVYYAKKKIAAESVDQQDVQTFMRNAWGVFQLLGIRSMGLWTISGTTPTLQYGHNVGTPVRQGSAGYWSVPFGSTLPSNDYLVFGHAMSSTDASLINTYVNGSPALSKTTTEVRFRFLNPSGTAVDPAQFWMFVFGG